MRILFSSLTSHGHTYPLLPLARAARDAGHEVLYGTGEDFHPVLESLGLTPVSAGGSMHDAFARASTAIAGVGDAREVDPAQRNLIIGRAFGSEMPRQFAADLEPVVPTVDLVVHEAGNPGAGLAARRAGVPGVCHGFGRMTQDESLSAFITDELGAFAAEIGVEVPSGDYSIGLGNPYLDIYPPSLQHPDFVANGDRIELRPVPYAEPGELPAAVTEGSGPLVYLTLGTAFGSAPVLSKAIEGLASLDVRVLVSGGRIVEESELGELPGNVSVVSWLPQADLLPHLDLVVHHGGSGTTLGALGAGVKQLFIPQGADQFVNAEAVVGGGAAMSLQPDDVSAEAVATCARKLLGAGEVDEPVRRIAAEIAAMPAPSEVARRLPELAR
ncbi:glycosyltransferase [Saccharopolyspora taberi]|uniref:Glycosyltransferase n=1 Tax=Saccharopolyspora taberi TaxID=60895 RepID=A0ABN3VHR4_9PSEU